MVGKAVCRILRSHGSGRHVVTSEWSRRPHAPPLQHPAGPTGRRDGGGRSARGAAPATERTAGCAPPCLAVVCSRKTSAAYADFPLHHGAVRHLSARSSGGRRRSGACVRRAPLSGVWPAKPGVASLTKWGSPGSLQPASGATVGVRCDGGGGTRWMVYLEPDAQAAACLFSPKVKHSA